MIFAFVFIQGNSFVWPQCGLWSIEQMWMDMISEMKNYLLLLLLL